MSNISYRLLGGPYYQERDKLSGIGPRLVDNTHNTFSIPSVWHSWPGYKGPKQNKSLRSTGKLKLQSLVTYREPFHSFKYYESLGSFYGMHEIINERENQAGEWQEIRDRWKSEPVYIDRLDRIRIEDNATLSYNNSSNDNCAFSMLFTKVGNNLKSDFDQRIQYDEDRRPYLEFHIGEFHLLPNTPRQIYRCNLATDLLYLAGGIDRYIASEDVKHSVLDLIPRPKATANSPVEFYLGIAKLSSKANRPKDYNNSISARHPNYIEGGAQIRWKSLSDKCTSWVRIYDGLDLERILSSDAYRTGHYVLNTKVKVYLDLLEALTRGHGVEQSTYRLMIYPPSFTMLPYDELDSLREPRVSMFLEDLGTIEFDVQRDYKTDGGVHYEIVVYDADKTTRLFADSTSRGNLFSYHTEKFGVPTKGKWKFVQNGVAYDIPTELLKFDSCFTNGHGIKFSDKGTLVYTPSEITIRLLKNKEKVYIALETIDGTRTNYG